MAALLFSRLSMPLAGPIKGDVVLSFPLTTEKLENIYVDARLYEYDPFLADASATLLDHVELEGINFSATADSLVNINFSATRKTRMKYYVTARTYSTKGGTLHFYINGFQKIFELVDTENINIAMTSKLTTKKPEGDPINVNVKEKNGKILDIHRAVEIVWKGSQGANFVLQKSSDLNHWKTVDALRGNGNITSVFLRISGAAQFWRIQPE